MIKKIRKAIILLAVIAATLFSTTPLAAAVTTKCAIQTGVNSAANVPDNCNAPNASNLTPLISNIITLLSVLVGAAAVVMLIIGGFRYVTSAGNDTAVGGAKKTILYAIVGLVIVALAQIIVHFVLNNVTGK